MKILFWRDCDGDYSDSDKKKLVWDRVGNFGLYSPVRIGLGNAAELGLV